MDYKLTTPCNNCPFRREGFIPLRAGRVREIARGMLTNPGHEFACHKTTKGGHIISGSQHCAGALIFAEKNNAATQMMRISERLRCYDRKALVSDDLVFDNVAEMAKAHKDKF